MHCFDCVGEGASINQRAHNILKKKCQVENDNKKEADLEGEERITLWLYCGSKTLLITTVCMDYKAQNIFSATWMWMLMFDHLSLNCSQMLQQAKDNVVVVFHQTSVEI